MYGRTDLATRIASEAQALTRAAPTAASFTLTQAATPATPGTALDLRGVQGFRVRLSADVGATLSGAGNLRCWLYEITTGNVVRVPGLDLAVPAAAASLQHCGFADQLVAVPDGSYLMYAADSVTVSAGACTVAITASVLV